MPLPETTPDDFKHAHGNICSQRCGEQLQEMERAALTLREQMTVQRSQSAAQGHS